MLFGLLGGCLAVLPLPLRLRLLGLPLMLPLLAPVPTRPQAGEVHVLAADVGQGTAVLVRTREHLLLYDAGPRYSPESDAAGRVLLPLLRSRAESHVDRLVLSHRDIDHTGGAQSLLAGVQVRSALSSLETGHPLLSLLPDHARCQRGQHWIWDGVHFEVLHPDPADYERNLKTNAMSCVIRVTDARGARLLLTGDIEAAQEAELLARAGPAGLSASILLLPHHGSRTSSTAEFLAAVNPSFAVAQAAHRSRFGHPAQEVILRVRRQGADLKRSDTCGAWIWPSRTLEVWPPWVNMQPSANGAPAPDDPGECERERRRRYWHHPGQP
jgi:competence protein ComEC